MMRTSPRRTDGAAGFTLIEMLVVLTIVALVAGLAITMRPRMGGAVDDARLQARLTAAINKAVRQARANGRPVTIGLDRLDIPPTNLSYRPAIGTRSDAVTVFADGSSSGGVLFRSGRPALSIDWLDARVTHVR